MNDNRTTDDETPGWGWGFLQPIDTHAHPTVEAGANVKGSDDDRPAEAGPNRLYSRPDYIGLVAGAQYKLENGDGAVTELALVVAQDGEAFLFEASDTDLRYLARQILALVDVE